MKGNKLHKLHKVYTKLSVCVLDGSSIVLKFSFILLLMIESSTRDGNFVAFTNGHLRNLDQRHCSEAVSQWHWISICVSSLFLLNRFGSSIPRSRHTLLFFFSKHLFVSRGSLSNSRRTDSKIRQTLSKV